MLLLTSPNDRLQIVTSAAATINVHASWVDTDTGASTITPGRTNTAITTAATTSVAGAPAAGVQRNVKTLHLRNNHATLACDVTVQHTDGTVVAQLYKVTLNPTEMLEYTDQGGFARGGMLVVQNLGGILTIASATQLQFKPYNGAYIKHNGLYRAIPAAGIAGLGNTNVRVGNAPGQNLTASTNYLLYITDVNGVLTGDFHQGVTHGPSTTPGNEGTEVMFSGSTPIDNFSFIGLVRTNASAQFVDAPAQRFVRSWFNRGTLALQAPTLSASGFSSSGAVLDYGGLLEWVGFADDAIDITAFGFHDAGGPDPLYAFVNIDGATVSGNSYSFAYNPGQWESYSTRWCGSRAEGYHFSKVGLGSASTISHTVYWTLSGTLG